jgi:hypothetical protein
MGPRTNTLMAIIQELPHTGRRDREDDNNFRGRPGGRYGGGRQLCGRSAGRGGRGGGGGRFGDVQHPPINTMNLINNSAREGQERVDISLNLPAHAAELLKQAFASAQGTTKTMSAKQAMPHPPVDSK